MPALKETRIQHKRHLTNEIHLWQLYGKRPKNQSLVSKPGELSLTQPGVQEWLLFTRSRVMSVKFLSFPELEGCSEGYSPCGTHNLLLCKTCTTTKSARKRYLSQTKLPLTILQTIIKLSSNVDFFLTTKKQQSH